MATRMAGPARMTGRLGRGRWQSSERTEALILAVSFLLLEILPIEAWLLVFAAYYVGTVAAVALPAEFLFGAVGIFALTVRALRSRSIPLLSLLLVLEGLGAVVVAARISSSAYGAVGSGPFDPIWLDALVNDLVVGAPRISALVGLAVVVIYLGWRGVVLGRGIPSSEAVLRRLMIAIGALVLAAVGAVAVRGEARAALAGALAVLLPLTVFAGLMAGALTRSALTRAELGREDPLLAREERWLALAFALALLVVVSALLASTIVGFDSLSAGMRALGPVGAALDTALQWLIRGLVAVLAFLFDGLFRALKSALPSATPPPVTPLPSPPPAGPPPAGPASRIPVIVTTALFAAFALLALLLAAIVLLRRTLGNQRRIEAEGVTEEREPLDARSLFRAQLRDLLRGRGRHTGTPEEPLPAGGIRALYREFLRVAAAHGLPRLPSETPDEHARRLESALAQSAAAGDASLVAEAYDAARYGEREPAQNARREVRERAARVTGALRRHETS